MNSTPPVKQNEIIKAGIVGWGSKGNPFVRISGYVIYIENFENKEMKIGEMIPLKIKKVFRNYAFAEILQQTRQSKRRIR